MKLRATERIFVEGALREEGEVFEAKRRWKYTELVGGGEDAKPAGKNASLIGSETGPTRKEIMAQLDLAGVQYKGNASKAELEDLLAATRKTIAPASSGAPSKDPLDNEGKGTGDQDVI